MSSPDNLNYPENSDKSIVSEISYNSESVYSNARNAHIDKRDELNRRLEERERDDDMYISELEQKIEALNLKISQITKEIKIEQTTRDEEALEYKEKIQKYKDNIIALSEKKEISIRAAENEHKRLLQEFERGMTERNSEIAELQLQLVQYKQESQDYASDIKKLISYNNELTSKVVSAEQSELNRHIQTLENQNTELNKQVQALQDKLIELTKPQSRSNSPSPESSQRGLHPFLSHNLDNSLLGRDASSTATANGENSFTGNNRLQDNHAQIDYIMDQMRSPNASPFQTLHGTNFQPGQTYQQEMTENLEQKIASLEQQLEYAKQNEEYMSRIISKLKNQPNLLINKGSSSRGFKSSIKSTNDLISSSNSNISILKKHALDLLIGSMYILAIIIFSIIIAFVFDIFGARYDSWALNGQESRFGNCPAFISDLVVEFKNIIGSNNQ